MSFTINVTANNDLYGLVSGSGVYEEGAEVTLTAVAKDGFRFVEWSDGSVDSVRTFEATEDADYQAIFERRMYYETTITVNSNGEYGDGTQIQIQAEALEGYRFLNWNDGNTENPRTITVNGVTQYTATFEYVIKYNISAAVNNEEYGTVSGTGTYEVNTVIDMAVTPMEGYRFVKWDDDNTDNPRSVTVTEDADYEAILEAIPVYTLTLSANDIEHVELTGAGDYYEGTDVIVTAEPDYHYSFVKWSDDVTAATRVVTVNEDITLTAQVEWTTFYFNITVNSSNIAYGSVNGSGTYAEGTEVEIEAVPASERYTFTKWNDDNTDNPRTITVTADRLYNAIFDEIPYSSIQLYVNDEALGSVIGSGSYPTDSSVTVEAIPNVDCRFVKWSDDNTDRVRTLTLHSDTVITAIFETITYCTVTLEENDHTYGKTEGAGVYPDKTYQLISAEAYEGFRFIGWGDNVKEASRMIYVTEDVTYRALFEQVINSTINIEKYKGKLGRIKTRGNLYSTITCLATLPNAVNQCIELGQFDTGTGKHFIFISVKQPRSLSCKQYTISLNHNHTHQDWFKVEPIDESDIVDTSYQLEVKSDGVSVAVRLKKLIATGESDFQVILQNLGIEDENWFEGGSHYIDDTEIVGEIASIPSGMATAANDHMHLANRGDYTHAEIDAHIEAANPHIGHERIQNKNVADGYAGLDSAAMVPAEHIRFGNAGGTVCEGDDARLSDRRTPVEHADTHKKDGSDELSLVDLNGNLEQSRTHDNVDTDASDTSIHHTLGLDHTQAAHGDHTHVEEYDLRYAPIDKGVEGGSGHTHDGEGTPRVDHEDLLNIGYYKHTEIDDHIDADAPHPGHELLSNKSQPNGYAGLNVLGKLSSDVYDFGTGPGSVCQGNDPRLSDARAPGAHAATHAGNGSDPINLVDLGGNLPQERSHDEVDTDTSAESIHHTLGTGEFQAAAGNHNHDDEYAPKIIELASMAGLGENVSVSGTADTYVFQTKESDGELITRFQKMDHSDLSNSGRYTHEDIDQFIDDATQYEVTANKGVANGYASLDADGLIPVSQLPSSAMSKTPTISDYDSLLALEDVEDGTKYMVLDASGDPTVDSGWAIYVYNSDSEVWTKLAEQESMDVVIEWSNVQNRPQSSVSEIDSAVDKSHDKGYDDTLSKGTGFEVSSEELRQHLDADNPHAGHEVLSSKGIPDGYCELDENGKVPAGRIPADVRVNEAVAADSAGTADYATNADYAEHASRADRLSNELTVIVSGDVEGSAATNGTGTLEIPVSIVNSQLVWNVISDDEIDEIIQ